MSVFNVTPTITIDGINFALLEKDDTDDVYKFVKIKSTSEDEHGKHTNIFYVYRSISEGGVLRLTNQNSSDASEFNKGKHYTLSTLIHPDLMRFVNLNVSGLQNRRYDHNIIVNKEIENIISLTPCANSAKKSKKCMNHPIFDIFRYCKPVVCINDEFDKLISYYKSAIPKIVIPHFSDTIESAKNKIPLDQLVLKLNPLIEHYKQYIIHFYEQNKKEFNEHLIVFGLILYKIEILHNKKIEDMNLIDKLQLFLKTCSEYLEHYTTLSESDNIEEYGNYEAKMLGCTVRNIYKSVVIVDKKQNNNKYKVFYTVYSFRNNTLDIINPDNFHYNSRYALNLCIYPLSAKITKFGTLSDIVDTGIYCYKMMDYTLIFPHYNAGLVDSAAPQRIVFKEKLSQRFKSTIVTPEKLIAAAQSRKKTTYVWFGDIYDNMYPINILNQNGQNDHNENEENKEEKEENISDSKTRTTTVNSANPNADVNVDVDVDVDVVADNPNGDTVTVTNNLNVIGGYWHYYQNAKLNYIDLCKK